jgi:hypothetical protein
VWWNEALLALPKHVKRLHLVFIGPEVTYFKASESILNKTMVVDVVGEVGEEEVKKLKREYFAGTLTEYFNSNQYSSLQSQYKGSFKSMIWLSNPGLGHPTLKESWQPSLQSLMISDETARVGGCPVLVTSHSQKDQLRDLDACLSVQRSMTMSKPSCGDRGSFLAMQPEKSPFSSMRRVIDKFSTSTGGDDCVQANWGAFGFVSAAVI